jgi:pilus assembly protein CpaD
MRAEGTMMKQPVLLSALVLAPALLLGACMGSDAQRRGMESIHQPVVQRSDYLLDLQLAGDRLASGESQRLTGWLDGLRVGYGDHVGLDDQGRSSAMVRGQVSGTLAARGMLISDEMPVTAAPIAPGTVRVVVSRMKATVPGCPDWEHRLDTTFEAATSPNYGCAMNRNLAAMVARPEDLIRGAGTGDTDPTTSSRAINSYRKAAPTGGGGTTVKSEGK